MNVGLWAEIRRLAEIEKLSARVISRRLHCSWRTVARALEWEQPPTRRVPSRVSPLDTYKAKIDALLARYPELSAVRIHEEMARGPDGYTGSVITVRRYVRSIRPARGRVYQEVHYEPAQAMQVDPAAPHASIPSSWHFVATITCRRSPANGVIPNPKESSRRRCAT